MILENKFGKNRSSMDLEYDELVYLLDDAISKKYGIWKQNVPMGIIKYFSRKSELLPNGMR